MGSDFEKQIAHAAEPALKEVAGKVQKVLDSMATRYNRRPVAEITPVLKRELARFGGSISDAKLNKYATAISEGTPIRTRVGK
jgi:hypothetical protein